MKAIFFILACGLALGEHYGDTPRSTPLGKVGAGIGSVGACEGRQDVASLPSNVQKAPVVTGEPAPTPTERAPLNLSEPPRRPFIKPDICTEEFSYVYKYAQKCTCSDDKYEYRQLSGVCELK